MFGISSGDDRTPISAKVSILAGFILILLCRGTVVFAEDSLPGISLGGLTSASSAAKESTSSTLLIPSG